MPETRELIGKQQFRAMFDPKTLNRDDRTVDVIFATEREVYMYNWTIGRFKEILICDDTAGDLTRLNNGAPLCDTHDTSSVRKGLGAVVPGSARFVNGKGVATVRFSKRKDVDEVFEDVADGILNGISVSYQPLEYQEVDSIDNKIPTLRCTKWEAQEISLALVQADRDSMVRNEPKEDQHEVTIIRKNSNTNTMSETNNGAPAAGESRAEGTPATPATTPAAPAAQGGATDEQVRAAATTAERARVKEITAMVRATKLGEEFAEKLIEDGTSLDAARKLVIDTLGKGETATPAVQSGVRVNKDETDKRRAVIIDSLLLRSATQEKDMKPESISAAREFRGMTLVDLAKDCLSRGSIDYRGLDKMEIVARAFTSSSSDFPVLLEGTTRRVLLNNYQAVKDTWRRFCMIGSVTDFREHSRLRMGSFSQLDAVGENGEFITKSIADAEKEGISISTKGNIINVTRVMIVNDDLSGFTRLAQMLGRAAARSIEIDVYALLASNPVMSDGVPLFHATHGNLISPGTAMSVDSFDTIAVKMAQQKDKDNNDFLDLRPDILLCGTAQRGAARVINDAQYDPDTPNKLQRPNKSRDLFGDIVDSPRITGTEYYAFADPSIEPVIEVDFLEGNQTPYLESKNGFEVDGVKWKVRHDYGVGAIGWRGAQKNLGA